MNKTLSYYFRNERATYICEHGKWKTQQFIFAKMKSVLTQPI